MPLLDDKQKAELLHHFQELADDVSLLLFTRQMECDFCKVTNDLLNELVALSSKIKLRVLDLAADKAEADRYRVDKAPAIVVQGLGKEDPGIRFFGVPAGHEFSTLVEDIIMISKGSHGLAPEVLMELDKVDQPVRIQVFISPTCPYCPIMVRAAHRFALASKFITSEMVEVSEFPELAKHYEVHGVPHTMIGDGYGVVGVFSDLEFTREVLRGIGKLPIEVTEHAKIHGDEIAGPETVTHLHDHAPQPDHAHHPAPEPARKPKPKPASATAARSVPSAGRKAAKKSPTRKPPSRKTGSKKGGNK